MAFFTQVRIFEEQMVTPGGAGSGLQRDYFDVLSLIQGQPTTLQAELSGLADPSQPLSGTLATAGIFGIRAHSLEGRGRVALLYTLVTQGSQLPAGTALGADLAFAYFDDMGIATSTGNDVTRVGGIPPDPTALADNALAYPPAWPGLVIQPPAFTPQMLGNGIGPPGVAAPTPMVYSWDVNQIRGNTRFVMLRWTNPAIP